MAPLPPRSKKSLRSEKRRFAKPVARLFSLGALLALGAAGAHAATLEWDPGMGTTTTGTGNWDTTTLNWYNGGNNDVAWPNSGADVAQFGNTTALNGGATEIAGTATTTAAIQANQIVFTLAGYIIANGTGGSLTLSGTAPTINSTVAAGTGVDTISAVMGGTAGLTKTGVGTVVLTGANTYTGTTTINGGTLMQGTGGTFGSTSATVTNPTVAFTGTAAANLGGNTRTWDNLTLIQTAGGITSTVTNGSLTLSGANNFAALGPNSAATSTEDLSGLTSLTYAQTATGRTINVGVGSNAASNLVLNLSNGTNTLTATNLNVGNGGGQTVTGGAATLNLGTTNTINSDNVVLGGYRSTTGTIQFNTGLTAPTVALRGAAGGTTPVSNLTVGLVQSGGAAQTGVFNTTAGTINAVANTMSVYIVGTSTPNGSANNTSNVGTFSFTNGTVNLGTLSVGGTSQTVATSAATVVSTVNQNAGALLSDSIIFGNNANAVAGTTTPVAGVAQANINYQSVYNLGSATTTGILSAGAVNLSALASGTTSRFTLNFNNGTITNYDNTANGFSGQGNANGSTTTNVQNLTLAGRTGGGTAIDANTLNIVLTATGTHNFLAEPGQTITQASTALITGSGALTANGAGTVTLGGANTYSGGTNVTAGMLTVAANSALGTGSVTLGASTTLTINAGVTITNMTGTTLTLASATTSIVNLLGAANTIQDSVNSLVVNGVTQAPGTYGAAGSGATNTLADFTGTGELFVAVPEPSTWAFVAGGFGLLGLARRRRQGS